MFGRSRSRGGLGRLLAMVGVSRLALLAWAWRNRNDLSGWVRLARRVPSSLADPVKRRELATEAKVRASITGDATARAAGLDVAVRDGVAHVVATRGSDAERALALTKLQQRQPNAIITTDPTASDVDQPASGQIASPDPLL